MSCKDFEQDIYLFTELSQEEKSELDAHLQTCTACAALMQEARHAQKLVSEIAEEKIIPANAAKLTSGIMAKIISNKEKGNSSVLDLVFGRLRFAMTIVSFLLLVCFAAEFLDVPSPVGSKVMSGSSVILTGKDFRENFSRGKVRPTLFATCQSPFKSGKYYLDCVKSKMK